MPFILILKKLFWFKGAAGRISPPPPPPGLDSVKRGLKERSRYKVVLTYR